jgi:hypothetical protein
VCSARFSSQANTSLTIRSTLNNISQTTKDTKPDAKASQQRLQEFSSFNQLPSSPKPSNRSSSRKDNIGSPLEIKSLSLKHANITHFGIHDDTEQSMAYFNALPVEHNYSILRFESEPIPSPDFIDSNASTSEAILTRKTSVRHNLDNFNALFEDTANCLLGTVTDISNSTIEQSNIISMKAVISNFDENFEDKQRLSFSQAK